MENKKHECETNTFFDVKRGKPKGTFAYLICNIGA